MARIVFVNIRSPCWSVHLRGALAVTFLMVLIVKQHFFAVRRCSNSGQGPAVFHAIVDRHIRASVRENGGEFEHGP
jgi:hypothetical protein